MADSELETLRIEVSEIRETLDRQQTGAKKLRRVCGVLTIFIALSALGFVAASLWFDAKIYPSTHQFAQLMGYQLLFAAIPLALLTQALRLR